MTGPIAPERERLARLLRLVEREDAHLQAVRGRLLGADCAVDASPGPRTSQGR